jgi:MbtH protein
VLKCCGDDSAELRRCARFERNSEANRAVSGSPFDDEPLAYVVVVNCENQHSLWPELVDIPGGWSPVFGPTSREDCLAYVDRSWTDMRPKSLIDKLGS